MFIVKSEVNILKEVLEKRLISLLYVLNTKPNKNPIFRGKEKCSIKPNTVINVRKVEYDLIINDLITVLKQLKGLKI